MLQCGSCASFATGLPYGQMFDLLYDRAHNVLLTRFSGSYGLEDIVVRDRLVTRFFERVGPAHRIADLTGITSVDVPLETIVGRFGKTLKVPDLSTHLVADSEPGYGLARIITAHQYFQRRRDLPILPSLAAACEALAVASLDLQPIDIPPPLARESAAMRFVAHVEEANLREDQRLDALARTMVRGKFDTAYGEEEAHVASAITVADLLNSELPMRIDDGDLTVGCHRCGVGTTLAHCRVTSRRDTLYACPSCGTTLVRVQPLADGAEAQGYPVGGFDIDNAVDIACLGVALAATR